MELRINRVRINRARPVHAYILFTNLFTRFLFNESNDEKFPDFTKRRNVGKFIPSHPSPIPLDLFQARPTTPHTHPTHRCPRPLLTALYWMCSHPPHHQPSPTPITYRLVLYVLLSRDGRYYLGMMYDVEVGSSDLYVQTSAAKHKHKRITPQYKNTQETTTGKPVLHKVKYVQWTWAHLTVLWCASIEDHD